MFKLGEGIPSLKIVWKDTIHSISPNNLSIALLGPNETTVYLLKRTTFRAHGYHEPPSMNILGNLPLQTLFIFLRKLFASRPLLPRETHTAITFSSSRSTAPQMNMVVPLIVSSYSSTATRFRFFFTVDLNRYTPQLCCDWDKAFQLQPQSNTES